MSSAWCNEGTNDGQGRTAEKITIEAKQLDDLVGDTVLLSGNKQTLDHRASTTNSQTDEEIIVGIVDRASNTTI